MKDNILLGLVLVIAVSVAFPLFQSSNSLDASLGGGGFREQDCDVNTVSSVLVGPDAGFNSTILSAHSTRAWATLRQGSNATNTISISFDEGSAAVAGQGIPLHGTTSIEFGRNTDFPYTGAVTGVTAAGTTTVFVTECRY